MRAVPREKPAGRLWALRINGLLLQRCALLAMSRAPGGVARRARRGASSHAHGYLPCSEAHLTTSAWTPYPTVGASPRDAGRYSLPKRPQEKRSFDTGCAEDGFRKQPSSLTAVLFIRGGVPCLCRTGGPGVSCSDPSPIAGAGAEGAVQTWCRWSCCLW
jgi:hypothetical protein